MKNLPLMYLVAKPPKLLPRRGQLRYHTHWGMRMNILDLVEDDAGGLVDAEQAHDSGEDGDGKHQLEIRARQQEDVIVLDALRRVVGLALDRLRLGLGFLARGLALARGSRSRGSGPGGWPPGRRLGARRSSHGGRISQCLIVAMQGLRGSKGLKGSEGRVRRNGVVGAAPIIKLGINESREGSSFHYNKTIGMGLRSKKTKWKRAQSRWTPSEEERAVSKKRGLEERCWRQPRREIWAGGKGACR